MPSGSVDARATVSCQGAFTRQFDTEMNNRQLIGGKTNLKQFDQLQQATSLSRSADPLSLKEVIMEELDMPNNTFLADTLKAPIYISNYKDDNHRFKGREASYKSNKSRMCSVVLAQSMEAKLQVTEGWEDNKTDLLFVLTAAEAACIGV